MRGLGAAGVAAAAVVLALAWAAGPAHAAAHMGARCYDFGEGLYPTDAVQTTNEVFTSKAMIQRPAPAFEAKAVQDGDFTTIRLSDYLGSYVVLFFYPYDFTFVCPTEIVAFSDRADEFRAINTHVIAASTDSHFVHLAWVNTPRSQGGLGKMNIPIVADTTKQISRDYGVLLEGEGVALRPRPFVHACHSGLFIIDTKGILRQMTINDLPVGRSVDETLRLVQAFQYTDSHGEDQAGPAREAVILQNGQGRVLDRTGPRRTSAGALLRPVMSAAPRGPRGGIYFLPT